MKKIIENLRFIKLKDIWAIFQFIFAIIPAIILKCIKKNIWLICEDENEARDNGYVFFKYMCERKDENINVVLFKSKRYWEMYSIWWIYSLDILFSCKI